MIDLGKTIRHIREARGLTQRAAAEALGITDVHLCNLERDKARPSDELLAKIGKVWAVDPYVLSWCLHGDVKKLPKPVRGAMKQLAQAWRAELEKQRVLSGD